MTRDKKIKLLQILAKGNLNVNAFRCLLIEIPYYEVTENGYMVGEMDFDRLFEPGGQGIELSPQEFSQYVQIVNGGSEKLQCFLFGKKHLIFPSI